jgi:AraC-like DNA-binding protein
VGRSNWSWSKDVWGWSPEGGRWSAIQYGRPREAVHVRLDTDDIRSHERYDFWRNAALYDVDADPRRDAAPFQAQASAIVGPAGAVFVNQAEALAGTRRRGDSERDGFDDIAIGLVTAGKRGHEEGDERSQSAAGQFLVFDARRASRVSWTSFATVHLTLRRSRVEAILGGPPPSSADLAKRLEAAPTGRIVAAHLRALAGEIDNLGAEERAGVLGVALDLAHLALRDVAGRPSSRDDGDDDDAVTRGLFVAALRLIETHLANPDLGPGLLARLLGCSRATLYRCFAERDRAIAEVIRARRLARARELLDNAGPEVSITEIALSCGYYDPAHFSRAFRREYGISPTDARG